jgi:AraC-like DNA-binding protein
VAAQDTHRHEKDSLRKALALVEGKEKIDTYNRLMVLYYSEANNPQSRDTLFALFDEIDAEAKRQGNDRERATVMANRLNVLNHIGRFDEVKRTVPGILDFIAGIEFWRFYYGVGSSLVWAYVESADYDGAMREAQKLYEHAKARNDAAGIGITSLSMSRIYKSQRRFDKQEETLRECIAAIKDSSNLLNILADAWQGLGFNLIAQKRYDDAIVAAKEMEAMIPRYEAAARRPMPNAWRMVYSIYTDASVMSGRYDEAEIYLNKQDSILNGAIPFYTERAEILTGRKRYAEALEMAEKAVEISFPNLKYQPLTQKAIILAHLGRVDSAVATFKEVLELIDAKHNTEVNTRLDEIRTQYEVEKHIAEKLRNRNYFLLSLGGCLLLLVALGIWIYHDRMVTLKNRELVRKNQQWANIISTTTPDAETATEAEPVPPDAMDIAIMGEVEKLIADGLYKDGNLSLNMLARTINQNPTYISKAVSRCTGKNFKTCVNEYRVKEAIRLLSEKDAGKRSVDDIAFDAGFNDRKTFHRVFKKTTGLTPAEFRKNAAKD